MPIAGARFQDSSLSGHTLLRVVHHLRHFCTSPSLQLAKSVQGQGLYGSDPLFRGPVSFATLASLLRLYGKAKALADARLVHAHISRCGYDRDTFLGNCLVQMYGECGNLDDARAVSDKLPNPNLYSWNILMKAYAQNRILHGVQAIFDKIPTPDLYSWNTVINAYGQNGSLVDAKRVFSRMPRRDLVSWNAMIAASFQSGHHEEALDYFHQIQPNGLKPNKISFVCALRACASLSALQEGQMIHAAIVDSKVEQDEMVVNALINMYGKCKCVHGAKNVFDRMPNRDVVSWNAVLTIFAENEYAREALDVFNQMQLEGIKPDKITFVCALGACTKLTAHDKGQEIHSATIDVGHEQDVMVATALIRMYGNCGSLHDARSVFDRMHSRDTISWNAMIGTCCQSGRCEKALNYFHAMQHQGVDGNTITFICVLEACTSLAALHNGQEIHVLILDAGYEQEVKVGTALVNMYGMCGSVLDAMHVFGSMPNQDTVAWTAMIAGFVQNGHGKKALDLFHQMHVVGIKSDKTTFICAVDACTSLAAFEDGKDVHCAIVDVGHEQDIMLGNALINMYGKCGSPLDANSVFLTISQRDTVSWNTMIMSFAQNGLEKRALDLFYQMQHEGIKADGITFISILMACSHSGWVDEGKFFFHSMDGYHGITPTGDHILCIIDLLGRAGHLDEAESLMSLLPLEKNCVAWLSLLGACRVHGDLERGLHAAEQCFGLDPQNAVPHVLLSNIYATLGRWDEVAMVRMKLEESYLMEQPRSTLMMINESLH